MTIDDVKASLPDVPVATPRGIRLFWLRGRQCPCAILVDPSDTSYAIQVAWTTVAVVLTSGRPVRL